jgi:hypothetical protein
MCGHVRPCAAVCGRARGSAGAADVWAKGTRRRTRDARAHGVGFSARGGRLSQRGRDAADRVREERRVAFAGGEAYCQVSKERKLQ